MQIRYLAVSLFLAATVAAAPFEQKDSEWPNLENSFNDIGNTLTLEKDAQNNPAVGNGVGSHNGNDNGNNNGNGNTIGSNNQITEDNEFLNINYGATSQQISEEVVAAMKSLTLICSSIGEGVMNCTWKS
ncbi:hypothetical protein F4823DRAFT_629576 [Ustulina deusta]|nr:hypothetical protein F4823DRAFT_629576 [Ustulina deusta]